MVHQCIVCKNVYGKIGISFHRFPIDVVKRKLWLSSLNISEDILPKNACVCSEHFSNASYRRGPSGAKFLTKDAVPEIRTEDSYPQPEHSVPRDAVSDIRTEDCVQKPELSVPTLHLIASSDTLSATDLDATITVSGSSSTECESPGVLVLPPKKLKFDASLDEAQYDPSLYTSPKTPSSTLSATDLTISDDVESGSLTKEPVEVPKVVKKHKRKYFIGDITTSDCSSPGKARKYFKLAKSTAARQRRKIKTLQKSVQRLKKRVVSLKKLLNVLRNKYQITENAANTIQASVPDVVGELFQRILKGPSTAKYTPGLRCFALTLNFYSPKAYEYVRSTFNKSLPDASTLSRWYRTVNGAPGFCEEALLALKLKTEEAMLQKKEVVCALMCDEMSIRSQIEWDGKEFNGFVDIGTNIDSDELPEATEVIVFMLVTLNGSWKIPVAYFFANGLGGREKANLLLRCLEFVHETGVKILSVTFDGAASNLTMAKEMGADFSNPAILKTWFPHPITRQKIYIFLDACHMIKLVRNCLASKRILEDDCGNQIDWTFVEKLVELQNNENLSAAVKLKNRHIQWQKEKMKVSLATQTLSKSVADALRFLDNQNYVNFQNSTATARFIQIFNDLFDILNSRNRLSKYKYKKPLSEINIAQICLYLDDIKIYIMSLKLNGISILQSPRKIGFLGFCVCIDSIKGFYESFVADAPLLKYVLTYKLSQDHLELFFGAIRSRGGYNNNPTARQFKAAFKRLLIHTEIKAGDRGNAVNLDLVPILHCSSRPPTTTEESENLLNSEQYISFEKQLLTEVEQYGYHFSSAWDLSDFVQDIVAYISGFVVKCLKKIITCSKCMLVIEGEESLSSLQIHKQYRRLTNASLFVVKVCTEAEKFFRFFNKTNNIYNKNIDNICIILIHSTLKMLPSSILDFFGDHLFDGDCVDGHVSDLIKLVLRKYFIIRIHYENSRKLDCSTKSRVRSILTKTILFKNQ